MNRRDILHAGIVAAALAAAPAAGAGTVDARDYDAFWLWAGVVPQPVLAGAKRLYILTGQVGPAPGGARLIAQGGAAPRQRHAEVWMAYRAHTLDWTPQVYSQILAQVRRWRGAGVPVAGIQIDFDAGTRRLNRYGEFLRDLRARLPPDCRLSITGLLDWATQGDPSAFDALTDVVDEVVIQTYQGRRTVPDYATYLAGLRRLQIPFRIGLVQGGEWSAPEGLTNHPQFRGYVVFLVNPRGPGSVDLVRDAPIADTDAGPKSRRWRQREVRARSRRLWREPERTAKCCATWALRR